VNEIVNHTTCCNFSSDMACNVNVNVNEATTMNGDDSLVVAAKSTLTSCSDDLSQEDDLATESPGAPSNHTSQQVLFDDLTTTSRNSSPMRTGRRSNVELSNSERVAKRVLKKHLKQRTKLRKYETRLQQAVIRQDRCLEERAQKEWNEYMNKLKVDPESIINFTPFTSSSSIVTDSVQRSSKQLSVQIQPRRMDERETERVRDGRNWIIKRWQEVLPSILLETNKLLGTEDVACGNRTRASILRQQQTEQARGLLQNMTKGTQTESMFTNELALAGYARQKFVERAVLAFATLDSLDPAVSSERLFQGAETCSDDINGSIFWDILLQIKQVWSIGCGPGCDAFGILAFLESHALKLDDGILLMDFVIDQWKSVVLNELIPILSPRYVTSIETEVCDVRFDLKTIPVNAAAMRKLEQFLCKSSRRIVVVSYLLTETRHQWRAFFSDLLTDLQGTQTLLLLSEPTAWQLHDFIKLFKDDFLQAYIWLDSSRDTPHLQPLESRLGPAILMVCTN
jgi:hypothetical protein